MLLDAGEGTWQQMVRLAYNNPSLVGIETSSLSSGEPFFKEPSSRDFPFKEHSPSLFSILPMNSVESSPFENMPNTLNGTSSAADSVISLNKPSIEETLARQMQVIWISHPHADHHLGLLTILSERKKLLTSSPQRESNSADVSDCSNSSDGKCNHRNENNNSNNNSPNVRIKSGGFIPIVLIAPPSVLAFLRDYSLGK